MYRWAVVDGEVVDLQGEPGDGTTIDFSEPFTMSIQCDMDG